MRTAICKFHEHPQCPLFVPDDTTPGTLFPFIHALLEILPVPAVSWHAFCFVRHGGPVVCMPEGPEGLMNWVHTFPVSVIGFLFLSQSMHNCPLVLPFARTLSCLLDTGISHNLI